jgi:predicted nucleic-acid-binding protein
LGWQALRLTADTNVLVRAIVGDDVKQSRLAQAELQKAELVAVSATALCELVWVLSQGYKISADEIANTIRLLINSENVAVDRPTVEAGLALLGAGGDFADGVIAFEGEQLGGETFASFDKDAVRLIERKGTKAKLLR